MTRAGQFFTLIYDRTRHSTCADLTCRDKNIGVFFPVDNSRLEKYTLERDIMHTGDMYCCHCCHVRGLSSCLDTSINLHIAQSVTSDISQNNFTISSHFFSRYLFRRGKEHRQKDIIDVKYSRRVLYCRTRSGGDLSYADTT